ncbi:hypothetical protein PG993_011920 [Apiospora rasikravindrae]|uniref:Uncharacterized protein n=1 Tax=Apiospora rasikravindrae TaxID=990691 RepID=A0ABR1S395_9PEZI
MRGLHSPSETLKGSTQHWNARNYIVHQGFDMGAVIEIRDEVKRPGRIDICELQALIILLDRQTVYSPNKAKLRAWVVSVKPDYFRALEAYVDQSVNPKEFHFSIVDEETWADRTTKNLESNDKQWKWLISWIFAQPIN